MNPVIGPAGDGVWVAWQNLTSGNWDIFARILPLTGCGEEAAAALPGLRPWPNPFRTSVNLGLAALGPTGLGIYDAAGRCVRSFPANGVERGASNVVWNGLDDAGRPVAAGAYFVRAGSGQTDVTRVLLAR